jgi:DNA modification methylase
VIDPFNGSGTTGAACIELGRRYAGIEVSGRFAGMARSRLEGITPPLAIA